VNRPAESTDTLIVAVGPASPPPELTGTTVVAGRSVRLVPLPRLVPPSPRDRPADTSRETVAPGFVAPGARPAHPADPDQRRDQVLTEVEGLWCHGRFDAAFVEAALARLPALRWIHSDFVGVDSFPLGTLASRGITLTNGAGNFARPMAEWVMLALLQAAKRFPLYVRRSLNATWDPSDVLDELEGAVLLLLGLGEVNRLVVEMARPFGLRIRAWARRPRPAPEGVERLVTGEAWRDELPEADYVVLGVPLTPTTAGLIDADTLTRFKPTAWLVNPARGGLVDEAALVAALDAGQLAGALLDAFVTEPLPASSPLWGRDDVIVVPHHTWSSPRVAERMTARFLTELAQAAARQPPVRRVDYDAGY